MDYIRKFVGTPQGDAQPSGADTIERLCDRVQSSTLLEDRRDAVRALKSLSKKFRVEVGTQSMELLINVLQTDRSDSEILGYALDTLCCIMSSEPSEEDDQQGEPQDLGGQFTEIFIKNPENVGLLLSLLEEYDFHVRWPTVKLMTSLLSNRSKEVQDCILASPMGVSKLMDLLSDSREIIRNDALLLLIQLTKGNANIQKIVAFENAYERLLDIVTEEGNSDGGIVVEDSLMLLLNLLKNNSSNQTLFREGSYIKRLTPYFDLHQADTNPQGGWSAQKVSNIHLMLQLVRSLVSPTNPQQQATLSQKAMSQCGLLQQLSSILMASGVPAEVLTETINTVSEVIRGNHANQEHFASVMAPSNPPRPAIVVLLMSMVNEKQPFVLRCAVLYCFQSFLYKNEVGQSQIVQTLLPSSADVNTITAGQLLCGGLFSTDSLSTWFAATALLHSIVGNTAQKEQLLRVQLATSLGNPPVTLLQQCTNILSQSTKLQTRVGLLMMICVWLSECPVAVQQFLTNDANVSFLISQVSSSETDETELLIHGLCAFLLGLCVFYNDNQVPNYTRDRLTQIVDKRINFETFSDKLNQVSKHEAYTKAAKKPHLNHKQSSEVLFDYEFCRLFKSTENEVHKCVSPEGAAEQKKKDHNVQEHESIVSQYKELIRDQDMELTKLRGELKTLEDSNKEIDELKQQVQLLKDQNSLLKTKSGGTQNSLHVDGVTNGATEDDISKLLKEIETQKSQLAEKDEAIQKLRNDVTVAEAKAMLTEDGEEGVNSEQVGILQATVDRLNTELEGLNRSLSDKDNEIKTYQGKIQEYESRSAEVVDSTAQQVPNGDDHSFDEERSKLTTRITELENDCSKLESEKLSLMDRLKSSNEENMRLQEKCKNLTDENTTMLSKMGSKDEEVSSMKKESEDLLVLLADQDAKVEKFKARLKELGDKVESDDDFEDDEEDEEEDD